MSDIISDMSKALKGNQPVANRFGLAFPERVQGVADELGKTFPAQVISGLYGSAKNLATLPGDVYAGRRQADPGDALDAASMITGGAPKVAATALAGKIPAALAALHLVPIKKIPGAFDVVDDAGKKVADSFMHYQPVKKNVYVDFIDANILPSEQAFDPVKENSVGVREMRSLFSAIADQFPNALTATGKRIGGARAKQGDMNTVATFRLPRKE